MQPQLKKTLWIVVPSILFLCVVLTFSVIYSINDKGPGGSSSTPAAANVLRFDAQNFAFVPPSQDWQQTSDPEQIQKGACLGFVRSNPRMMFVVIATRVSDPSTTLDAIIQQAAKQIQDSSANANFSVVQQPASKNVHNIPGESLIHRASVNGVAQTYVHWFGLQNGMVYHVMTIGLAADEKAVMSEADAMLDRFHPLSDFPAAAGGPPSLAEFTSKNYHYVVHFNDPNWHQWPDFSSKVEYAELGVLNGNDTVLTTSALYIGDIPADFDALLLSFSRVLGINLNSSNTERLHANGADGAIIAFATPAGGTAAAPTPALEHVLEILRVKSTLFIGHGWTSNQQKLSLLYDQLRNKITFPADAPTAPVEMTAPEQQLCGKLLNELGITYVRANRPALAIPVFEKAQSLLPAQAIIADNKAVAQLQNNQPKEARLTINLAMQQFASDPAIPALKARAAQINDELGENNVTQDLYASIFSKPDLHYFSGSDTVMFQYAKFLMDQGSLDQAKEILEKYRDGSDASRGISVLYATILGKKGDHAAAIALLEKLRATAPTTGPTTAVATSMPSTAPTTLASASPEVEPDVLIALGKEYNAAARFADALDLAGDLIKRGVDTADAYLIQAGALAGTKKFTEAKTAIDAALQRNPTNRECFDVQRAIADGLNQNDKSLYTKPIDAVEIPKQTLEGIPADPTASPVADALGAYYVARVGAVAFEAGKDYRASELQRIKALTRQGGQRVSMFDFPFDPSIETIYINQAQITDSTGKVVATAGPQDSFIVDAPADGAGAAKKILRVSVAGLAPDCTLNLLVTRKQTIPPAHMKFTRYYMSTNVQVQRTAFVLRTPDPAQIIPTASAGIDKKTVGDAVVWQLDNPTIYRSEPIQEETSNYLPVVTIGDAKLSWEQVGDDYLASLKDVLVDDPECKTLAASLTSGKPTDLDKVDALAIYVQKEIANKTADFASNNRIPRKPAEVIKDKSGDAKDQALLLYQLLRAAGFDQARLALVDRSDRIEENMPSLDQFDHMVVCLPGSNNVPRFIDCTEKDLSVDSPTDTIAASKALVLQSQGSSLLDVPALPDDASTIKTTRDITMDVHGTLTAHDRMELSGPAAALWRGPLKALTADQQKQQVADVLTRAQVPATITQLNISPLDDPQKPLVIDITYTCTGRFQPQANNTFAGTSPATWIRHWLIPPQLSERMTPFYVRVPMKIVTESILHLPDKVKLVNSLDNQSVDGKFGTLKSTYTVKPGEVDETSEIHTTAGRFDAAAYTDFFTNRRDIIVKSEPQLDIQGGN